MKGNIFFVLYDPDMKPFCFKNRLLKKILKLQKKLIMFALVIATLLILKHEQSVF